jgi:prepilin-type N-terminal cleavage/methylation domain-containing protein
MSVKSKLVWATREEGFTFIEVLVAIFVLAVGILAALGIFTRSGEASATAQRHDVAIGVASEEIEQIRALVLGRPGTPSIGLSGYAGLMLNDTPSDVASQAASLGVVSGTGNNLTVGPGGATEPVVYNPSPTASTNSYDPVNGIAPYSLNLSVGSGASAITYNVYRFVSWHKETCPVLSANTPGLSSLANFLQTLYTNQVQPAISALQTLITPAGNGLVQQTQTLAQTTLNQLGSLNSAIVSAVNAAVPNGLTNLTATITQLNGILQKLPAELQPFLTDLQQAYGGQTLSQLFQAVINDLGNGIDLCQLPNLNDLRSLDSLDNLLTALGLPTVQQNVQTAENDLNQLENALNQTTALNIGPLVSFLSSSSNTSLQTATNALQATQNLLTAPNFPANLTGLAGDTLSSVFANAATDLNNMLAELTNPPAGNTKRITVAVVVTRFGNNYGPFAPVWASTIITDRATGLL